MTLPGRGRRLSLSTCWRPRAGASFLETLGAAQRLGFDAVEIGVADSGLPIAEIVRAVEQVGIAVSSLHNFVTAQRPVGLDARGDDLSSLDTAKRREAVRLTRETIELARHMGAQAVVIHAGAIEVPDGAAFQRRVMTEYAPGDPEAARIMQQLWKDRQARAEPFFQAALRSLREICDAVSDISLGVESRYYFYDIPSLEEAERIFDEIPAANLGYWHDIGHGQVRESLGLELQLDWLTRFQSRLVGLHLHDMQGFRDHRAPGSGWIDFERVVPFAGDHSLLVMELADDVPERDVLAGKAFLERVLEPR